MSRPALVDLTISSDEEVILPNRPPTSKKLTVHHNGSYPGLQAAQLVDLSRLEQDFPYLQSESLYPRPLQKVYRSPQIVRREPENGIICPRIDSSLIQDPLHSGQGIRGMTNGGPVERQERSSLPHQNTLVNNTVKQQVASHGITVQSLLNENIPSPKSLGVPNLPHSGDGSMLQDHVPDSHPPVTVLDIRKQSNLNANSFPSRSGMSHDTPDLDVHPTEPSRSQELPLSLESFQRSLQKSLHDLRTDHQYYVKSRLPYARQRHSMCNAALESAENMPPGNSPDTISKKTSNFMQRASPFADLRTLSKDQPSFRTPSCGTARLCQLGSKATKQGPEITSIPCLLYNAGNITIPPYTNYISTKRNILTEDDKNRTFLPYYGDDAYVDRDYAELESRITRNKSYYRHTNNIAEKVKLYGPYTETFLADVGVNISQVLRYLLDETIPPMPDELDPELAAVWQDREAHLTEGHYESGGLDTTKPRNHPRARQPQKQWRAVFDNLPPFPTTRSSAAAGLACMAFADVMGFSIWHVVKRHRLVLDSVRRKHRTVDLAEGSVTTEIGAASNFSNPGRESDPLGIYTELGCMICYAHECPGHGEFDDTDDEKNIRIRINVKPPFPQSPQRKTATRNVDTESIQYSTVLLKDAIGLNDDKSVSGTPWITFREEECGFKEDEVCSDNCFWLKSHRSSSSSTWSTEELKLFNTLLPAYQDSRRGACMLALGLEKQCNEIFVEILRLLSMTPLTTPKRRIGAATVAIRPAPRRHFQYWLENSITWEHHERPPFKPCSHLGRCSASTGCYCYEQQVTCEKPCLCADNCLRRFSGCTCAARGSKVCWQNDRCDCFRLNRECDPDLCRGCGAHEVLDPANRYNTDLIEGKCTNVFVQRGVPRRTLLGHSKLLASGGVSGWGLYMGEATKKGDYIGEYVGEVISKEESEQRGIIYNKRNLSYLFDLNSTQTLDSTLVGNKFRYINHQAPPYANCQAKTLFCNTVHRIGMFACRNIEVGEEILFDYGEGFAAKFELIKLDEQAQPRIEKGRKSVTHKTKKDPNRAPTLSKNGKRIGRPRKYAPSDQGVQEGAVMVENGHRVKKASALPKKTLKRKRPTRSFSTEGPAIDDDFEDVVMSEDVLEDPSSESFDENDHDDGDGFGLGPARPNKQTSSSKRGWRTRMAGGGRKKGRGGRPPAGIIKIQQQAALDRQNDTRKDAGKSRLEKYEKYDSRDVRREDPSAESRSINQVSTPQRRSLKGQFAAAGKGQERETQSMGPVIQETPQTTTPQKRVGVMRPEQVESRIDRSEAQPVKAGSSSGHAVHGSSEIHNQPKRASKSSHRSIHRMGPVFSSHAKSNRHV